LPGQQRLWPQLVDSGQNYRVGTDRGSLRLTTANGPLEHGASFFESALASWSICQGPPAIDHDCNRPAFRLCLTANFK